MKTKFKNHCHPGVTKKSPLNYNGASVICKKRCDEKHRDGCKKKYEE